MKFYSFALKTIEYEYKILLKFYSLAFKIIEYKY